MAAATDAAMIQPQTALQRVLRHCAPLGTARLPLAEALGCVLAEDVRARVDLPVFDNSQMDGYAVRARDCARATPSDPVQLRVVGTLHAGMARRRAVRRGEAIAVATGAPLPRGADAVVPIEVVSVNGGEIRIGAPVAAGRYVRRRGEDICAGARLLSRGTTVHAGAVSCLATVGRSHVRVVRPPRVAVITTGDEIVEPGRTLAPGQVYDGNVAALGALLRQAGLMPATMRRVRDDVRQVERALSGALATADVVVTVGGVSVGPHDFIRGVLPRLGVRDVFWGVSQQPGKPLYFGHRGRRLVFGLPGNPVSAFVCFCFYVLPALRALGGHRRARPAVEEHVLANDVRLDARRWRLLRARLRGNGSGRIEVLAHQGSHMVTALATASHLVLVPPAGAGAGRRLAKGSRVRCIPLPYTEGMSP